VQIVKHTHYFFGIEKSECAHNFFIIRVTRTQHNTGAMDATNFDKLLNDSRTILANSFQDQSRLLQINKSLSDIIQNYEKEKANKCVLCKGSHHYTAKYCNCKKNIEHRYHILFHILKIINDELNTEYVPQDVHNNFVRIFRCLNASTVSHIGEMIQNVIRSTRQERKRDRSTIFSHEEEQSIIKRIQKLYSQDFNTVLGKSVQEILQKEAKIQKTDEISLTCIRPENMTKISNMIQKFDSHINKLKKNR
jgi:uncharacterized protein YoaH (UPF0181 family)